MSKFQRLTQIEAGPLTASGAKVITHQFDGSAGGINWGKSYMELETQFVDPAGNPYVQPVALMDLTSEIKYSPSAMLQNVRLSHSAAGVLEENRNVNVHNQTEQYITKTRGELQTKLQEGYGLVQVDAVGLGHLIIPCSDILGMGKKATTMDGDKVIPYVFPLDKRGGDCTLRCELEDQVPLFCTQAPIIGTTNPGPVALVAADIAGPANNTPLTTLQLTTRFGSAAAQALYLQVGRSAIVSFTLGGNPFSVPVVLQTVAVPGAFPAAAGLITFDRVWVNQPALSAITNISLQLTNASAITGPLIGNDAAVTPASPNITIPNSLVANFIVGATYTSVINVITAGPAATTLFTASAPLLTKTQNGPDVDLTFGTAAGPQNITPQIPTTAADDNSQVFLYLNKTPLVARVNQVNLNLYRQPSPNDSAFIYSTLSLEKAVVPSGLTQYQNQFQLESSLEGFKLLLTQQNKLVAAFAEADLSSYRVAINNKDVSNRDLVVDPLQNCQAYLNRLKLYYGMLLHNLNRNLGVPANQQYLTAIAEKFNSVGGDMVDLRYQFGQAQVSPNVLYVFKDKVMSV
jgi:hypothetical protein